MLWWSVSECVLGVLLCVRACVCVCGVYVSGRMCGWCGRLSCWCGGAGGSTVVISIFSLDTSSNRVPHIGHSPIADNDHWSIQYSSTVSIMNTQEILNYFLILLLLLLLSFFDCMCAQSSSLWIYFYHSIQLAADPFRWLCCSPRWLCCWWGRRRRHCCC